MANKVWIGTQTAYNSLTSHPTDDEFFTTVNESVGTFQIVDTLPASGQANTTYLIHPSSYVNKSMYDKYTWTNNAWKNIGTTFVYTYHDGPSVAQLESFDGAGHGCDVFPWTAYITVNADGSCNPRHFSDFVTLFSSPTKTWNGKRLVLNKLYRGSVGTRYKEYKFKYTDDGNPSSYDDVRAGSWVFIGYTTKTPAASGIRHRNLVETLPDVAHMTDSQIRAFLNGDYKNVLLVQIGDSTIAEELVDVQTISDANRTKYLYQT